MSRQFCNHFCSCSDSQVYDYWCISGGTYLGTLIWLAKRAVSCFTLTIALQTNRLENSKPNEFFVLFERRRYTIHCHINGQQLKFESMMWKPIRAGDGLLTWVQIQLWNFCLDIRDITIYPLSQAWQSNFQMIKFSAPVELKIWLRPHSNRTCLVVTGEGNHKINHHPFLCLHNVIEGHFNWIILDKLLDFATVLKRSK